MDTAGARLLMYDMTVVFPELKINSPLAEVGRRLLPQHPSPMITWIPDQLLAIVYPERQLQCQFGDRRVRLQDQRGLGTPGEDPFATVILNAINGVTETSNNQPSAYGYNFVLFLPQTDPATYIKNRFFQRAETLEESFSGKIVGIGLSASLQTESGVLNINLNPAQLIKQVLNIGGASPVVVPTTPEHFVQAAVNYHFEGKKPPETTQAISDELKNLHESLIKSLDRL